MKKKLLVFFIVSITAIAAFIATTGCKTTTTVVSDGKTNVVTQFDPVKTAQVKAAIEPVVAGAIRRVIKNSPQHSVEIGDYMRAVGYAFCTMRSQTNASPELLITMLDTLVAPKIQEDYIIDIKNAAVSIYKINYGQRFQAELPPDKWPYQVADLLCTSIDTGLKDSGLPGCQ